MSNLWEYEEAISKLCPEIEIPNWIDEDISPSDVAAIVQGGCVSGAYMPAVTHHLALRTMNEHGDDVLDFLDQEGGGAGCYLGDLSGSWAGMACNFLSAAVELWANGIESTLESTLSELEETEDE